ncbi:MAG: epoxyqueuosine reductase [Oscillospiraceae bacterium]|nr:epoxyqueuosine reductase [Oscillospiraceae bacterium]
MKKVLENSSAAAFGLVSFQHLNTFEVRSRARIPQNAMTVAAMVFPYYNKNILDGNVSGYCAVADYHIVVMEQLKSICDALKEKYPNNSFVPFVDSSPIDEVDMAVRAGLGVKGDNSLLITPKWGSFVFIGEIVTDLKTDTVLCADTGCSHCGRCKNACPGGATGDGFVKKENCASHISQKKGELTQEETEILKRAKTVFGCDICQKVCPHNKDIPTGGNLFGDDIVNTVDREIIQNGYKQRAFGFRGAKVLERNLQIYEE